MEEYSSDEGPASIAFSQAKIEAMQSLKHAADSAKSTKDLKKKKQQEHLRKMKTQREMKLKVKKLPDEVVNQLSTVPSRTRRTMPEGQPKTKKLSAEKLPKTKKSRKPSVEDFSVPNTEGCTTRFQVMDLKKLKEEKHHEERLSSFRQKMLARNPRQPVSSYLMCLRKRKASGKEKFNS
ncbi:uncharacterized protein LOC108626491 isoform X2 [Ceratina calcarata]|uniref:Uncharacterized protein LOC108626491 isoform X2 n=1 Tax=Ceratina calcarata TaxID=156304 RepID=A0AAJ7WC23_9HYME|nr:uncharacterized protein LOC108626491 isoform X2 [Ceratina calcarata]